MSTQLGPNSVKPGPSSTEHEPASTNCAASFLPDLSPDQRQARSSLGGKTAAGGKQTHVRMESIKNTGHERRICSTMGDHHAPLTVLSYFVEVVTLPDLRGFSECGQGQQVSESDPSRRAMQSRAMFVQIRPRRPRIATDWSIESSHHRPLGACVRRRSTWGSRGGEDRSSNANRQSLQAPKCRKRLEADRSTCANQQRWGPCGPVNLHRSALATKRSTIKSWSPTAVSRFLNNRPRIPETAYASWTGCEGTGLLDACQG